MFRYKPPTATPQSFASARPGTVRPLQSSHLWITFAIHLEDVALVREPVEQRRRHALALEHLAPLPERQVARQQQAPAFVAVREHLEEQFGAGPAEREAPQFVHDQRIETLQGGQEAVEAVLLLGASSCVTRAAAVMNFTRRPSRHRARPSAVARCVLPVPLPPIRQQL